MDSGRSGDESALFGAESDAERLLMEGLQCGDRLGSSCQHC